ncbi:MAG: hypothetical protein M1561_01275 [Gammaproteobacteria bacterium]|nr:hypothetical protein [Gammaproteobacteria bacterium]
MITWASKISLIRLSILIAVFISTPTFATSEKNIIPDKNFQLSKLETNWRFNFDSVKMPSPGESNMGLLGISYLANINKWLYAGFGGYGSVTGERGGLFVLGFETGLQYEIFKNIYLSAGIYTGGGGGGSSLVGSGLMLRPRVGLAYDFKYFKIGVDLSNVRFPDGKINSTEAAINLSFPGSFFYSTPENTFKQFSTLENVTFDCPGLLNFSKNVISLIEQNYFTPNAGTIKNAFSIGLIGIEVDHFLTKHGFAYLKSAGGFAGKHNGYMDLLGGFGYEFAMPFLSPRISIIPRVGAGAGGGGNVEVGGGILTEPSLGIKYQLSKKFSTEIVAGYLFAPNHNFNAYTLTAKLSYDIFLGKVEDKPQDNPLFSAYSFHAWQIRTINQTYFKPQRKNGNNENINLFGVKFDDFLTKNFYLTGQGNSAYAGQAGGYSSGLLGFGVRSNKFFHNKIDLNAEILAGAGGGGSLDVSGGALLHPNIGITYHFTKYVGIQAEVGRIIGLRGKLNATTLDAGLVFDFTTLEGL